MERGRISRRRDCHASDRSHVSVDPFSVPLIVDCLTSPEHNTEKQPDSDSELRGRRLAWSRGLTPPRGYQSPILDGKPGALATPRNRGQRSWVQIPPAPPSTNMLEDHVSTKLEKIVEMIVPVALL